METPFHPLPYGSQYITPKNVIASTLQGAHTVGHEHEHTFPGLVTPGTMTTVYGSFVAILTLKEAFYGQKTAVSPRLWPTIDEVFQATVEIHIETGNYPTQETTQSATPLSEEFEAPAFSATQFEESPPFDYLQFDIDAVLLRLRRDARLQGGDTTYQLGVLTQSETGFTATVLPMHERVALSPNTTTIWLHRVCQPNDTCAFGHSEMWYAFTSRVRSVANTPYRAQELSPIPVPTDSDQINQPYPMITSNNTRPLLSMPPMPSAPMVSLPQRASTAPISASERVRITPGCWTPGTIAPLIEHPGTSKAKWDNLFLLNGYKIEEVIEDILNGAVHPDNICGPLILEIATIRSNSEIKSAMHRLYLQVPGKRHIPSMHGSAYTKLITMALKVQAGKEPDCAMNEPAYLTARSNLNAIRARNGVKFHTGKGANETNIGRSIRETDREDESPMRSAARSLRNSQAPQFYTQNCTRQKAWFTSGGSSAPEGYHMAR